MGMLLRSVRAEDPRQDSALGQSQALNRSCQHPKLFVVLNIACLLGHLLLSRRVHGKGLYGISLRSAERKKSYRPCRSALERA